MNVASLLASFEIGIENVTSPAIAIRGERLALDRLQYSGRGEGPEPFYSEMLRVLEVDAEQRITAGVYFDLSDIDAAFEELDSRYLAGEAAGHAHTWSVISSAYAAFNRHELQPTTPEWVDIDHRLGTPFEPSNLTAPVRAIWDLTPDLSIHIEAVHRLNNFGAVITHTGHATSQEGFAEWRAIDTLTVGGDLINRCEVFDEADLDAALARFDELHRHTTRLENAASRTLSRYFAYFAARDWAAIAETLTDDSFVEDRNYMVNAGFWDGRDAVIANLQALEEAGARITFTVIATRGERLALSSCVPRAATRGTESSTPSCSSSLKATLTIAS